jgi:hypothetical protein
MFMAPIAAWAASFWRLQGNILGSSEHGRGQEQTSAAKDSRARFAAAY